MSNESNSPFAVVYDRQLKTINPRHPLILGPETLTYGDVFHQVPRLAALYAQLGIGPGDRVALASVHDSANVAIYLSLQRCGITASVLNPRYAQDEMTLVIATFDPKAIFVDREILETFRLNDVLKSDIHVIEIWCEKKRRDFFGRKSARRDETGSKSRLQYPALLEDLQPVAALPAKIPDTLVADIRWTSGSTSAPKGVEHTHRALMGWMLKSDKRYAIPDSRILNPFPLINSYNFRTAIPATFGVGSTIVRPARTTNEPMIQMLDSIYFYRVTHLYATSAMLSILCALGDKYLDAFQTEDFQYVSVSGGPLDADVWRSFEEKFQTMVVHSYGVSEALGVCCCGPEPERRKIGTVGKRRRDDIEVRLIDEQGCDVDTGCVGEVIVRSPFLMKGYFRMPEETGKYLRDGWFHTGDLGKFDSEDFLTLVDRKKNIIIRNGENIIPNDITNFLVNIPGVMKAATLGMPDPLLGERVVSCVMPLPDVDLTEDMVKRSLSESLSPERMPDEIHVIEEFPVPTRADKVAVGPLRELLKTLYSQNSANRSDMESRVLRSASEAIMTPVDKLSLGSTPDTVASWDSFAHVRLITQIEHDFGVSLTPRDVMAIHSLRDAVQILERRPAS